MTWTDERHKAVRERLAHVEFPDYEHLVLDGTDIDWIEQSQHDGSILAGATVAKVKAGPDAAEMFFHAPTDLSDALDEIERLQALPAVEAVAKAWSEPGPVPGLHEQMRRNVRHDMPLLGRALDRLEQERKEGE